MLSLASHLFLCAVMSHVVINNQQQQPGLKLLHHILDSSFISYPSKYSFRIFKPFLNQAMGWMIGVLGFDSRRGLGIFLFTTPSRTALGPTQPPIQWVPRAISPGVNRPERVADHSSPSSAKFKNAWSYTFTSPVRLHGVVLSLSTGTNLPITFS
jgi:hypothetical protein